MVPCLTWPLTFPPPAATAAARRGPARRSDEGWKRGTVSRLCPRGAAYARQTTGRRRCCAARQTLDAYYG